MANKTKGIVKLNSQWTLRYPTNSMVELEDETGMPAPELLMELEAGRLGFKTIRTMVWAGLIHAHENEDGTYNVSLKQAGEVLDEFGFEETMDKVREALELQFPDDEEEEEKPTANREQRRQGANQKN